MVGGKAKPQFPEAERSRTENRSSSRTMITSEELIRLKWPKGKVFGLALRMAERMAVEGVADELVLGRLAEILQDPARFLGTEGEPGEPLG